jgi:hypothetical protein
MAPDYLVKRAGLRPQPLRFAEYDCERMAHGTIHDKVVVVVVVAAAVTRWRKKQACS